MTKKIIVRAKEDILIDMMFGIMFETIYSDRDYLVTGVSKNEVNMKSIEDGGCHQVITIDKDKFKELLTSRELIAL
mgnify:CR=1 FL=1